MHAATKNIISMKWGTKYGPEYVNRLFSMVRRNLSGPFRFICLTDNAEGLEDGIVVFPIPSLELPSNSPERGWHKLTTFNAPFYDIVGPCLFLDLDIVIVDSIDCFFEIDGEFLIIKDWIKKDVTGNSSVYRFEANKFPDVLDYFVSNVARIRKDVRNEQEYLSKYMAKNHSIKYWPDTWCRSFKRHCIHKGILSWFKTPRIPENAKIIAFHGIPNPDQAIIGKGSKWYRKMLPTPWIETYWK